MQKDKVNIKIMISCDGNLCNTWDFYLRGNGTYAVDADLGNGTSGIYNPKDVLFFDDRSKKWLLVENYIPFLRGSLQYVSTKELVYKQKEEIFEGKTNYVTTSN
jgi:hypothetical protein